jgi:hypothetical protein
MGSLADNFCDTMKRQILSHLYTLKGLKANAQKLLDDLSNLVGSLGDVEISFDPPEFDPTELSIFASCSLPDDLKEQLKNALSNIFESAAGGSGLDVNIVKGVSGVNSLYASVDSNKLIDEIYALISCISLNCALDMVDIVAEVEEVVSGLFLDDLGGLALAGLAAGVGMSPANAESLSNAVSGATSFIDSAKDAISSLF